ncbi:unnamed protein product [Adineta steineri]|uniref:Uncharacterized protein n=1 Tax=Adineta steineri TaxID=433720 RepID=A0A820KLZ7_9BILA|nr:unnamed protein product [Adineta steineri]CAF4346609.1 unnamed protein product [Adineta steineri]
MTDRTLIEKIKPQIRKATDLNKLFEDNKFLTKLKNLSSTGQLEIFKEHKDKFIELSKNPQSAIAKWIGTLPNTDTVIQQGQKLIENVRHSLK